MNTLQEMVTEAVVLIKNRGVTLVDAELWHVLSVIRGDVHGFGTRPCRTCEAVTRVLRSEYGCARVRKLDEARRAAAS